MCTLISNNELQNTEYDKEAALDLVPELCSQFLEKELPTVHIKGESQLSQFQRPIYLPDSEIEVLLGVVIDALVLTGNHSSIFTTICNKLLNKGYDLTLFYRVVKVFIK